MRRKMAKEEKKEQIISEPTKYQHSHPIRNET